jgi:quinol-cytochrome oxidoreductase complex cytochrome b subunit/coenzyme F420-reducing hydrogenase delta subunit
MLSPKRGLRAIFERVESSFDGMFSPTSNPFYQLGALGWFFYWIVVVSGIYVYLFFDTGVTQAYESLERITNDQWYAGGIMRSLHRYAADALVIVVILHLLREFSFDRLRGHRWFAWFTGVPLLWFIYVCGITGYWLVWDSLAQYVAIMSMEWLDALPFFGEPIAANFASSGTLSGRFFTLLVYMHIAIPLFMLFLMWVHIQRHASARTNPHRVLAVGTFLSLLALSLIYPAVSQEPANLDTVPATINLDWFYLALYPLLDVIPGGRLWLIVILATVILIALPWLPPIRGSKVAVVDLENCNGCGRCYSDCPFSAITMEPRSDGAPYEAEAVVDAARCVSCGICAGACPTATPYRRMSKLVPGIQLPDYEIAALRERIVHESERLSGDTRVIVFGCDTSTDAAKLRRDDAGVVTMPCVGMLPPSFIDFVISRKLADGVFVSGCQEGDCHYRLGSDWTEQRLAGQRDPYLRKRVPRERLRTCWARSSQSRRRIGELDAFKEHLAALDPDKTGQLADVPAASGPEPENAG